MSHHHLALRVEYDEDTVPSPYAAAFSSSTNTNTTNITSSTTTSSSSSSSSPFHAISPDCRQYILSYHLFRLRDATKEWRPQDAVPRIRNHREVQKIHIMSSSSSSSSSSASSGSASATAATASHNDTLNWHFLRKNALSCEFLGNNALEFVSQCRCIHQKPSFYYLRLSHLSGVDTFPQVVETASSKSSLSSSSSSTTTTANDPNGPNNNTSPLQYLRGVTELDISSVRMTPAPRRRQDLDATTIRNPEEEDSINISPLFPNLRGIKKLTMMSFLGRCLSEQHLTHLRGIRELSLVGCDMTSLPPEAFQNLRGIQSLTLLSCKLNPDANDAMFRNLRGIKFLMCRDCHNLTVSVENCCNLRGIQTMVLPYSETLLSDQCIRQLRGIQQLYLLSDASATQVHACSPSFTNEAFKNMRGIKVLSLCSCIRYEHITDEAFENLRGVQRLSLYQFPDITSGIFRNLIGILQLDIKSCPNVEFSADTLQYLRGLKHLRWERNHSAFRDVGLEDCEKLLDQENMKQLYGAKRLVLGNVVTSCDEAFRYLSQVKELILTGPQSREKSAPLSAAAFLHFDNATSIVLKDICLDRVHDFLNLLRTRMPKLTHLDINSCSHGDDSIPTETEMECDDDDGVSIGCSFVKDPRTGEWLMDPY